MAYVDSQSGAKRATSLITVGAIHVVIGATLIYGLAPNIANVIKDGPLILVDIPPEPTPIETPPPDRKVPEQSAETTITAVPSPIDVNTTTFEIPPGPTVDDTTRTIAPPLPLPLPMPEIVPPKPAFTAVSAKPANDRSSWVTAADYPGSELRRGIEGSTQFRAIIGSNGRVQACEIMVSSGSANLDKVTCAKVTSRAKFNPATDTSGNTVVGSYTGTVVWQIPQ